MAAGQPRAVPLPRARRARSAVPSPRDPGARLLPPRLRAAPRARRRSRAQPPAAERPPATPRRSSRWCASTSSSTTPGAPVVGFAFTAQPDRPRPAQLSIFGPAALSPERLATTLARLFALLGPGRMGSPRTADGHRPERFALADFHPPPPPEVRARPPRARGLLAVRVLRPAIEVEVSTRPAIEREQPAPARHSCARSRGRRFPTEREPRSRFRSDRPAARCAGVTRRHGRDRRRGARRVRAVGGRGGLVDRDAGRAASTGTSSSTPAASIASIAIAARERWFLDGIYD